MSESIPPENPLWKRPAYAALSSDLQTTIKGKGATPIHLAPQIYGPVTIL